MNDDGFAFLQHLKLQLIFPTASHDAGQDFFPEKISL
jgi:hypothetical protein